MSEAHILLVDDDQELTDLLMDYLEAEGLVVSVANSGEAALKTIESGLKPDLAVLDIMMPGISGLALLQQLRPAWSVPVIMLTGRGEDIDRILGLEMGADDYLSKPCNPRELLARIRAVLRRAHGTMPAPKGSRLTCWGITLDPTKREVLYGADCIDMTSAEFNVLHQFMQHPGEIISKSALTERVLHRNLTAYDRAIDVHVSRVRQKLAPFIKGQELIKTVRGEGYLLVAEN